MSYNSDCAFSIIKNNGIRPLLECCTFEEAYDKYIVFRSNEDHPLIQNKCLHNNIKSSALCISATEDELIFQKDNYIYHITKNKIKWIHTV